jgi:mono/diheme cytochrome c family protein
VKRASTIARVAIFIFFSLVVVVPRAVTSQNTAREPASKGRRIFVQSCSSCHDALGTTAKSGPSLKSYYQRQPRPADAAVRTIIEQGRGRMPAFSLLDELQINNLVAYLKTL